MRKTDLSVRLDPSDFIVGKGKTKPARNQAWVGFTDEDLNRLCIYGDYKTMTFIDYQKRIINFDVDTHGERPMVTISFRVNKNGVWFDEKFDLTVKGIIAKTETKKEI